MRTKVVGCDMLDEVMEVLEGAADLVLNFVEVGVADEADDEGVLPAALAWNIFRRRPAPQVWNLLPLQAMSHLSAVVRVEPPSRVLPQ